VVTKTKHRYFTWGSLRDDDLKIFAVSISAFAFDPLLAVEKNNRGVFICRPGDVEEIGAVWFAFAQEPLMCLWCSEDEARKNGFNEAKALWPEHAGWTHHSVMVTEVPRQEFIKGQVFMSLREIYLRALKLAGFMRGAFFDPRAELVQRHCPSRESARARQR
jgi:hypothetical protein